MTEWTLCCRPLCEAPRPKFQCCSNVHTHAVYLRFSRKKSACILASIFNLEIWGQGAARFMEMNIKIKCFGSIRSPCFIFSCKLISDHSSQQGCFDEEKRICLITSCHKDPTQPLLWLELWGPPVGCIALNLGCAGPDSDSFRINWALFWASWNCMRSGLTLYWILI